MAVEFRVLGDVGVLVDGQPVVLGHSRQLCVLVALLVDANQPVTVDRVIDRVWGDHVPQRAHSTLYTYVSRLRQVLADADGVAITRQRAGYMLTIDPVSVDMFDFGELVAQARADREDESAQILFARALGLWQGDAFAALDTVWIDSVRDALHRQRVAAELDHTDVLLRLGRHAELVAGLFGRAHAHPLDERLSGQLMLALHRSGRTGDALAHYLVTRSQLAEELGIDPGPELQRLHGEILAGSPVDGPAAPRSARDPGAMVPRQLPAPPPLFTGRADELNRLSTALPAPEDPDPTMAIWAIDGTGGVGKTWLALRWAHEHAQAFPDGQLYLNLRGFGSSGSVLDPADAVPGLLAAFGVVAEQIPAGLDAQIGLYRSVLSGKRVLMVLDNARDVEQVRPLLPGSAGCLVVVTSRNRLSGLVATHGARPLSLDLLTVDEARNLLAGRLGADRTAAEPDAVAEIIARCARLPLALAIAAARGATHPEFPLAALADELHDAAGGLDAFAAGDAATDVRSVFSWSYRALSADAARLFRLFGLHCGPDITLPAATSLAGQPRRQVRDLLAELTRAHLLIEHSPGRYSCHDLLRAYATEQAHAQDDPDARQAALHRVLDHYLHTAYAADRLLEPKRVPIVLAPPRPGVVPGRPGDHQQALAWFISEHQVLLAAVDLATAAGFDTHTLQLAWALWTFLLRRGHWHDQVTTQCSAIAASGRSADPTVQARAHRNHRNLAHVYTRLGRYDEAHAELRQALDLCRQTQDQIEEAYIHQVLAFLLEKQGCLVEALDHAQQSLKLQQDAGHRHGHADLLNTVGWYHALLGDHQQAVTYCEQALGLLQELGSGTGLASTWASLGYAHRHLGHHVEAVTCYQHALDLFRDFDDRYGEAETLTYLGDTHLDAGQPVEARKAWEQALHILDQLAHHSASGIRVRLHNLQPATLAASTASAGQG